MTRNMKTQDIEHESYVRRLDAKFGVFGEIVNGHPVVISIFAGVMLYNIALTIYRLYLSPLSRFPGPMLAAASGWYESYYELVKNGGGNFTFHIRELHKIYGPIVRISPVELHIDDVEYYENIYTSSRGFDKSAHVQYRFGAPEAAFSTPSHEQHRQRRGAINPFFAKRRIEEQSGMIQGHVDKICKRIENEYVGTDRVLVMNDVFSSYVTDVIMTYAFNRNYGFVDQPDFVSAFTRSIQGLKDFVHFAQQLPWLPQLLQNLPDSVVATIQPSMGAILHFQREMASQVREVTENQQTKRDHDQEGTIFHSLLSSDLPPSDLSVSRLRDEALSIVGAGIETTKMAQVVIVFHIVNNPKIHATLQAELKAAMPDPAQSANLRDLENLPYLQACIKEGIRLSYGAVARSQRISRVDLRYNDYIIPAGVMMSCDTYHMHHTESVFTDSFEFIPERWLNNPRGPDGFKALTRYLAAFGRGTRMCLGLNLAYAEMTLALGSLFRRFDFELFETDQTDVDCYKDMVGMEVKPGSKGVRFRARAVLS